MSSRFFAIYNFGVVTFWTSGNRFALSYRAMDRGLRSRAIRPRSYGAGHHRGMALLRMRPTGSPLIFNCANSRYAGAADLEMGKIASENSSFDLTAYPRRQNDAHVDGTDRGRTCRLYRRRARHSGGPPVTCVRSSGRQARRWGRDQCGRTPSSQFALQEGIVENSVLHLSRRGT